MEELLKRHIQRITQRIKKLEATSSTLSKWRLITFFAAVLLIFARPYANKIVVDIVFLAIAGAFIALAIYHVKIENLIKKFGFLKEIKEEHLARKNLDWQAIEEPKYIPQIKDHPFAYDLYCIGDKSLHKLLDTTIYKDSSELLTNWLLETKPNGAQIVKQTHLIKELSNKMIFRDKLRVASKFVQSKKKNEDKSFKQLIKWLKTPTQKNYKTPLFILSFLAVSNITLGVLFLVGMVSPIFFVISLLTYLFTYKANSDKIDGLFDAASYAEDLFTTLHPILKVVEDFKFRENSAMTEFVSAFQNADVKPSVYAKKVGKIAGKASLQANQILWPLVNILIPWDLYYAMRFENLKTEIAPKFELWLNKIVELEALCSLANFAGLNPDYSFPEFMPQSEQNELFYAEDMGHPLIKDDKKITNNFKVDVAHNLFLITGSNMAGKSTFLRTVGINLVLAFVGAPVNATKMKTSLFRIYTGINITDSLGDGLSHFYAEVKRLKSLLNALKTEDEQPLFYFVDEIYKGTNNRERLIGSSAFLKEVAKYKGVGLVTTHDLELAEMEKDIKNLSNWHFTEEVQGNRLDFDYKIKRGASPSTNALKIMANEGLPV